MKKFKAVSILCLTSIFLMPFTEVSAESNIKELSPKEEAIMIIDSYNDLPSEEEMNRIEEMTNPLFVNPMEEEQKNTMETITNEIEEAKTNGEQLYSYEEILGFTTEDVDISEEDLSYIKENIQDMLQDREVVQNLKEMGYENNEVTINIEESLNIKIPKSFIIVPEVAEGDGKISGGGWPACNDDNGWGPKKFLNSDCYKVIIKYKLCWNDIASTFMGNPNMRYCIYNARNCSPKIGHSKYGHKH